MLKTIPAPCKHIKCDNKSNIRGHIMTVSHSTTKAVDDRLNKANSAWGTLRRSSSTNINFPTRHRLIILHAPIGSIILYSLQCYEISITNITRLQSFYSKCIRDVTQGILKYDETKQNNTNISIRATNNIHTIKR